MPEKNGGAGAEQNNDGEEGAGFKPDGGLGRKDPRFFGGIEEGV